MELARYKDKIISLIKNETPIDCAKRMTLSLVKSGRLNEYEASVLLKGFDKVNIHFIIDNHVEINATHWGDIATGDGVIEEGYFATTEKRRSEWKKVHS